MRQRLQRALATLRRGGVIAFPTETFYALGADPRKRRALSSLRLLKGRERGKPLLLLAASRAQALALAARPLPASAPALARRFWPGPLTLVLPPRDPALARALGRADGLAVRVTSHPLARRLLRAYGFPITGTSANRSGRPPRREAGGLPRALGIGSAQVLDGGRTPGGAPSTLLDLSGPRPRLLRAGAVPERLLGPYVRLPGPGRPASPPAARRRRPSRSRSKQRRGSQRSGGE